jgi:hypothetical protein
MGLDKVPMVDQGSPIGLIWCSSMTGERVSFIPRWQVPPMLGGHTEVEQMLLRVAEREDWVPVAVRTRRWAAVRWLATKEGGDAPPPDLDVMKKRDPEDEPS